MCQRTKTGEIALLSAGISFVVSCLFQSWLIRLLIGVVLIVISLLLSRRM